MGVTLCSGGRKGCVSSCSSFSLPPPQVTGRGQGSREECEWCGYGRIGGFRAAFSLALTTPEDVPWTTGCFEWVALLELQDREGLPARS